MEISMFSRKSFFGRFKTDYNLTVTSSHFVVFVALRTRINQQSTR